MPAKSRLLTQILSSVRFVPPARLAGDVKPAILEEVFTRTLPALG